MIVGVLHFVQGLVLRLAPGTGILPYRLDYEGDEGVQVQKGAKRRPAVATILPDGSVVAGDPFPEPQS
jgi:hypothetical protein